MTSYLFHPLMVRQTYKKNASVILREFFQRNVNRSEEQQKFEIVSTAAKLIKSDIKQLIAGKETYIIDDDLSDTES